MTSIMETLVIIQKIGGFRASLEKHYEVTQNSIKKIPLK
jgi:hypothetical protein